MTPPLRSVSRRTLLARCLSAGTLGLAACATTIEIQTGSEGRKIELKRTGKGHPAIVLVHGLGDDMNTWRFVQKPLSAISETIAFNRPGYGQSPWEGVMRDGKTISDEMRSMLQGARVPMPVILVGHSLGGVYAQIFARRFPDEVAGLVLIDTTVPGQTALISRLMPVQFAALPALMMQESAATRRELEQAEAAETLIPTLPVYRGGAVEVLAAARGDILSTTEYLDARRDMMRSLATGYAGNFRVIDAGHFIHQDNPAAVIEAVKRVIAAVKPVSGGTL